MIQSLHAGVVGGAGKAGAAYGLNRGKKKEKEETWVKQCV
jgi:hypothetical protein